MAVHGTGGILSTVCLLTDGDGSVGVVVSLPASCSDSSFQGTALADLLSEKADSAKYPGVLQ